MLSILCLFTEVYGKNDCKMEVSVTISTLKDSPGCYQMEITSEHEMQYIMHYINSMSKVDDGVKLSGADLPQINILVYENNKIVDAFGFVCGRLHYDGKQYAVQSYEYDRFVSFLRAVKSNEFKADDNVSYHPSEWAESYIDDAVHIGLVPEWSKIGYKSSITRVEVCQLIDNFLEKNNYSYSDANDNPFKDTADVSVIKLYNKGIINGKSDDEFCPYDFITREEYAKILYNAICNLQNSKMSYDTSNMYNDDNKISRWAKKEIGYLTHMGMFKGDENGNFMPKNHITKEQVIVTILRYTKHK